jgi:hypothetical protein
MPFQVYPASQAVQIEVLPAAQVTAVQRARAGQAEQTRSCSVLHVVVSFSPAAQAGEQAVQAVPLQKRPASQAVQVDAPAPAQVTASQLVTVVQSPQVRS